MEDRLYRIRVEGGKRVKEAIAFVRWKVIMFRLRIKCIDVMRSLGNVLSAYLTGMLNELHVRSKRDESRINSRFSFESLDECLLVPS